MFQKSFPFVALLLEYTLYEMLSNENVFREKRTVLTD